MLLLPCLFPVPAAAQAPAPPSGRQRETTLLTGWRFDPHPPGHGIEKPEFDDSGWQAVTLPHTWNAKTQPQTHRGAWYRTHFALPLADKGRHVFVAFDSAGAVADVSLNGAHLGQHRGAFTRFVFDGTAQAVFGGDNVLAVRCDTDPKDTADCLPDGTGFQLYQVPGGLYRPVRLWETAPVHLDPTGEDAAGAWAVPSLDGGGAAMLTVHARPRNDGVGAETVTVRATLRERDGPAGVMTASETLILGPHTGQDVVLRLPVARPHLWGQADPYLYQEETTTIVGGQVTDGVTTRTGFRSCVMTAGGFLLNGLLTPLRGVAKHQENEQHGAAVTEDDLRQDWHELAALGVNFVRLAHYPHAALEYDLADEAGTVVWAENGHSNAAAPTPAGDRITREMVRQNSGHPSICFWSVGNEAIRKASDIETLEHYARTVRAEDATRPVTYASSTLFHESPALDLVAVNRYPGWYGGRLDQFAAHAAFYHSVSETGAGGVVSTHTASPRPGHIVNRYEPEEYQQEAMESRCRTVFRDIPDQVFLFTWWVFREFADPRYKGVNTKGLETYGGARKDAWYLYQSFLRPSLPVVHLCGRTWPLRRRVFYGDTLTVKAYANAPTLTLTVNGLGLETKRNGDYVLPDGTASANVFAWDNALTRGRNVVVASDGAGHSDTLIIYAEAGESGGLVQNLTSSNTANPAYFLDIPIEADSPVFDDDDGTADNTFAVLPNILAGARPLLTGRPSKLLSRTSLIFTIAPEAGQTDVFVMLTLPSKDMLPTGFLDGFTDTGVRGVWRDNAQNLVPYALYRRTVSGGTIVHIPGATLDYAILVKPHPASAAAPLSP